MRAAGLCLFSVFVLVIVAGFISVPAFSASQFYYKMPEWHDPLEDSSRKLLGSLSGDACVQRCMTGDTGTPDDIDEKVPGALPMAVTQGYVDDPGKPPTVDDPGGRPPTVWFFKDSMTPEDALKMSEFTKSGYTVVELKQSGLKVAYIDNVKINTITTTMRKSTHTTPPLVNDEMSKLMEVGKFLKSIGGRVNYLLKHEAMEGGQLYVARAAFKEGLQIVRNLNAVRATEGKPALTEEERIKVLYQTLEEENMVAGRAENYGKYQFSEEVKQRIREIRGSSGGSPGYAIGWTFLIDVIERYTIYPGMQLYQCANACKPPPAPGKCTYSDISMDFSDIEIKAYGYDENGIMPEDSAFETKVTVRNIGYNRPERDITITAFLVNEYDEIIDANYVNISKEELFSNKSVQKYQQRTGKRTYKTAERVINQNYPAGFVDVHNYWDGLPAGIYKVVFMAGGAGQTADNIMKECNYGNNIAYDFVFVTSSDKPETKADLTMDNLRIEKVKWGDKDAYRLMFDLHNLGNTMVKIPAGKSGIAILQQDQYRSDNLASVYNVVEIYADGEKVYDFTKKSETKEIELGRLDKVGIEAYMLDHQNNELVIYADPDDTISESNEKNNRIYIPNYHRPDFIITDMATSVPDPVAEYPFKVKVTVKNIGDDYSAQNGNIGIAVRYGKPESQKYFWGEKPGLSISSGDTFTFEFNESVSMYEGENTISADVISIGMNEGNRYNNRFTRLISVAPAGCEMLAPVILGPGKSLIEVRKPASFIVGKEVEYDCGNGSGPKKATMSSRADKQTYITCDYPQSSERKVYGVKLLHNKNRVCSAFQEVHEPDFSTIDIKLKSTPAIGVENKIDPITLNYGTSLYFDYGKKDWTWLPSPQMDVYVNDEKLLPTADKGYLWTPKKAGWNTVRVSLDQQNKVAEYDENNNVFSKDFYVKIPTDVGISNISVSVNQQGSYTNDIRAGDKIYFGVNLFKVGDGDLKLAKAGTIEFYANNVLAGSQQIPAGTYVGDISYPYVVWTPQAAGVYELKAKILKSDGITAKEVKTSISVDAPDISISKDDIVFSHPQFGQSTGKIEPVIVGDSIGISTVVRSYKYTDEIFQKITDTRGSANRMLVFKNTAKADQLSPLYTFNSFNTYVEGFHNMEFEVGASKSITEKSTTNNKVTIPVKVAAPAYQAGCDTPIILNNNRYAAKVASGDAKLSTLVVKAYLPQVEIKQPSQQSGNLTASNIETGGADLASAKPSIKVEAVRQVYGGVFNAEHETKTLDAGKSDYFLSNVIIKLLDSSVVKSGQGQKQGQSLGGQEFSATILAQCPANTDIFPTSFQISGTVLEPGKTVHFSGMVSEKPSDPQAGVRTIPEYNVLVTYEKVEVQRTQTAPGGGAVIMARIATFFSSIAQAARAPASSVKTQVSGGTAKKIVLNQVFSGKIAEHKISTQSISGFSGLWKLPSEKGFYKIKVDADASNAVREPDTARANNHFETTIEVK